MKYQNLYQQEVMREEFNRRKSVNKQYSIRAFSRHLELDISTVSRVMSGKRILSQKNAIKVSTKLGLQKNKAKKFIANSLNQKNQGIESVADTLTLDLENYGIIVKEWEYFTMLDLIQTKGFVLDFKWIAMKMMISKTRAQEVFNKLRSLGFINVDKDNGVKVLERHLVTTEDIPNKVLLDSHVVAAQLAINKLNQVGVNLRDYSSITIPTNPKKLPLVKEMIRKFRREILEIMKEGDCTEVYQMNIQLFPLTDTNI